MPDIVLTTLNAKYIHAAFGLRYLLANLGELRPRAGLVEFDINQRPLDIVEALLAHDPKVLGLGVYIWNATESAEVVAALKRVRPDLLVVLGGPEVSYETESQAIVECADYVICGEADLAFAQLCWQLLRGERSAPKIIPAAWPDFSQLALPYDLYTDADIAHRIIYVEASRGCPFSCEFCLSSLDVPVRQAPLPQFLEHLQRLLDRGARQFKFVDRTFNVDLRASRAILEFLLDRYRPGHFFHFEMVPDRLPEALREVIARFPPGALQFEIGVQSLNEDVCRRISRRQDLRKLEDHFHFLRTQTGVHIHADLIVGLPGETLDSFAAGFDRLVGLDPQEIQVGILKRLRGTPIGRHDAEWQMVYSPHPPYEILQNRLINFATMQKLRRFARYWDLVSNSGNFVESLPLIWSGGSSQLRDHEPCPLTPSLSLNPTPSPCPSPPVGERVPTGRVRDTLIGSGACSTHEVREALSPTGGEGAHRAGEGTPDGEQPPNDRRACPTEAGSPFWSFLRWSEWLYGQVGRTDSIALVRLAELLFRYLTTELGLDPGATAETMSRDYQRGGRSDTPEFLRPYIAAQRREESKPSKAPRSQKRQGRHLKGREA